MHAYKPIFISGKAQNLTVLIWTQVLMYVYYKHYSCIFYGQVYGRVDRYRTRIVFFYWHNTHIYDRLAVPRAHL